MRFNSSVKREILSLEAVNGLITAFADPKASEDLKESILWTIRNALTIISDGHFRFFSKFFSIFCVIYVFISIVARRQSKILVLFLSKRNLKLYILVCRIFQHTLLIFEEKEIYSELIIQ